MISKADITTYFVKGQRYNQSKQTDDIANHMAFHMDGHKYYVGKQEQKNPFYAKLISERRPRESEGVQEYREKIFKDITKSTTKKVVNSVQKIFKASDWKVDWSKIQVPPSIKDGESLQDYTENKYPGFGSLKSWMKNHMMREMMKDPNGVQIVMPAMITEDDSDYNRPEVFIIPSADVYQYEEGNICVVKSEEKHTYVEDGQTYEGVVMWFIDREQFVKVKQNSTDKSRYIEEVYADLTDCALPMFFRSGGEICKVDKGTKVFESFLSGMLPYLDEASREYSDVQASVVQHLYPQMWYMKGMNCQTCSGKGQVRKDGKGLTPCDACGGSGKLPHSPYKDIAVNEDTFGDKEAQIPPAGEITKSTAITELQEKRVDQHKYNALSAINMEFLASTPLAEIGIAKEFDREELHNFVFGIAEHITAGLMVRYYYLIAWWRYSGNIYELMPSVSTPEKYDLISDRMLVSELVKSKEADIDPVIRNEQEIDFASKRFRTDEKAKSIIIISKRHDPFPGIGDKSALNDMVLAGTIDKIDAVLSIYITSFIITAFNEDPEFLTMSFIEQAAKLREMAAEKVNAGD